MNAGDFKCRLNKMLGRKEILIQQQAKCTEDSTALTSRMSAIELTQALIQKVAQETQEMLRFQIEDVVNEALNTCFPDTFEFKANFVIKRGKTECELVFLKDGYEVNPLDATGGGVADIASMGLRIAAWSLSNTRNLLIFDEGLKWLSRDLQPRAGEILQEISKTLGLQVIMVSHSPDLIASSDKVFEIKQKDGISLIA
jgi:DNA repair exonuclease SbcCD ATPase subunit